MGMILDAVNYVAGWIAMLILAICIASGLYVASEVAEESSSLMRKILKRYIVGLMGLRILLLFDGVPVKHTFGGMACDLAFVPLLRDFPFVEPVSFPAIIAFVSVVANHYIWFNYYGSHGVYVTVWGLLGFFLVFVWALPTGFFVSLTLADEALPSAMATQGVAGSPEFNGAFAERGKRKGGTSFFKQIVNTILAKKDDVVQSVAPGQSKRYY